MVKARKLRSFPFLTNDEILQFGNGSNEPSQGLPQAEDGEVNFKGSVKEVNRFELHDSNHSVNSSCLGACTGPD